MKKALLSFLLVFFAFLSFGQQIKYAAPVPHTEGAPTGTPTSYNSWLRYDKTGSVLYRWNGSSWTDKISISSGSNKSVGSATLSGGTVTVSNTSVTSNSKIFVSRTTPGGFSLGSVLSAHTITNGVSFVISSFDVDGDVFVADNTTVNWLIIN